MRILYIHPFGAYGGATKSLAEMYAGLPAGSVDGVAIAPHGVAADSLEAVGMRTIRVPGLAKWDDTRFGHYRGARWAILLRELAYWPATVRALRAARREGPFDLIHCNELPALFPAIIAKRWLNAPLLVHVRSLQRGSAGGTVTRWILGKLRREASAVVAIDEAVRRTLPDDLQVHVIHNGMRAPENPFAEHTESNAFRVGIIGVLHRAKGVYEFAEAARIVRSRGIDAKFVIVGENVHRLSGLHGWMLRRLDFAHDVRGDLEAYVARHGLQDCVEFTGFVRDIASIYSRLDAVCFPSHLDAPGRPVFEAALFGLPTIVAMRNPTTDVVIPDITGLCIDEPAPEAIADAISTLASDRSKARALGEAARANAVEKFDRGRVGDRMVTLYRKLTRHKNMAIGDEPCV